MKTVLLATAALALLTGAATADSLTPGEINQIIHNAHVVVSDHGTTFTVSSGLPGSRQQQNPDVVQPQYGPNKSSGTNWGNVCGPNAIDIPMPGGKTFCEPHFTEFFKGADSYTVTLPGGTTKVVTCTRGSVSLHVSGNPFKLSNWSKTTTGPSTTDGSC
jgi:hypothetical protein